MQHEERKRKFMKAVGVVFKEIREEKTHKSINEFAREYDVDRGNLSKIERGVINCRLITAWKLAEGANISFVEFAQRLQKKLGNDFMLMDE